MKQIRITGRKMWEKNWSGASAGPNTKKDMELAWKQLEVMLASPNRSYSGQQKATEEDGNQEKRSGEGNVDSRIQVQLEEDGGGSIRQSWNAGWRQVVCGLCSAGSDKA